MKLIGFFLFNTWLLVFLTYEAIALSLRSNDFLDHHLMSYALTCEGTNHSPHLQWGDIPKRTQSFVLIMDDPDASKGIWVHWVLYDIPAWINQLSRNQLTFPGVPGQNSWAADNRRYRGPCPPRLSGIHRYLFKLYALDKMLNLVPGMTKTEVFSAMQGHILEQATLIGLYERE